MGNEISVFNNGLILAGAEASDDLQRAADAFRKFLLNTDAFAPNTIRSFKKVMTSWQRWCLQRNLAWFPIHEDAAAAYLANLYDSGLASTSVSLHYAMLNMMLKQCNMPTLATSQEVSLVMRRIQRQAVTEDGEQSGQAIPLRLKDLQQVSQLLAGTGKLTDERDRAFLYVAYNTLLRISELARIRVRDISYVEGKARLSVGHTKTMVTAAGLVKPLSQATTNVLNNWLDVSGLRAHPEACLFTPVKRNNMVKVTDVPLTTVTMEKIFAKAWKLAGKIPAADNKGRYTTWTGHSARVGASIDMSEAGVPLAEIMRDGTWKNTDTLMRYLRAATNNHSANSNLMDSNE